MSIFKKIGNFFKSLFNAAERAYNKLTPEQQEALQKGTGLTAIINDNLSAAPAEVLRLMHEKFPNLDAEKLSTALFDLAQSFNLTKLDSLEETVVAIQTHLNNLEGKFWAHASHAAASLLAIVFAPPTTKVAVVVSLLEWVYQKFIKKGV